MKLPYLLTIQVRFETVDDAMARAIARGEAIPAWLAMARRGHDATSGYVEGVGPCGAVATAKLQRLNDNAPPRLLARWPED